MSWEKIEQRLKKALGVSIAFPAGTVWLPDRHLSIDDWLTSIAETDEELRELDIPRIRFLQNRWRMDPLLELEWDDEFSNRRVIVAMYVGQRAYILFSDWSEYQVVAAVEPKDNASLYRAVIGKLLENRSFVRTRPTRIRIRRPDLVPDFEIQQEPVDEELSNVGWTLGGSRPHHTWKRFLSDVLVGWIGRWLSLPEMGFWHEDMPESISSTNGGKVFMKYKSGKMPAASAKSKAAKKYRRAS